MPSLALALVSGRVTGKVGNAVTDSCLINTCHCLIKKKKVLKICLINNCISSQIRSDELQN